MSKIVPISFHAVFQFHYGTIKSLPHPRSPKNSSYFNSTMVRLKVCWLTYQVTGMTYFNSTMVRLKELALQQAEKDYKFQFHYGTIKRQTVVALFCLFRYFNSTMVRLKGTSHSDF